MAHKYVKLHGLPQIFNSKEEALSGLRNEILSNLDEYQDGELLALRYYDADKCNITAIDVFVNIVDIDGDGTKDVILSPDDGIKLIESDTEPDDHDAIWIQDSEETVSEGVQGDIKSLQKALKALIEVVNRHEHAFTHAMNSGDIFNSAKAEMMAGEYPELTIDGLISGDTDGDESEEEGEGTGLATDFDLYLANTPLSAYTSESESTLSLYRNQRYFLRCVFVPSGASRTDNVVEYFTGGDDNVAVVNSKGVLSASTSGYTTLTAVMTNTATTVTKSYTLSFGFNEEPDYCSYSEPNVKHLLIKSVPTYAILTANTSYLCTNELVWCEGDNSLYIRAKAADGTIRIFKLNGGGSSIITGDTSGDTSGSTSGETIDELMSGITQNGDSIASIRFVATSGNKYNVAINDDGEWDIKLESSVANSGPTYASAATVSEIFLEHSKRESGGLYINAVYCGGVNNEYGDGKTIDGNSFNQCSHNFVELSNTTKNDIPLSGLSIQYATAGTVWKVLPLKGTIKKGSTFLIRGSQCGHLNTNTPIKVTEYDMLWEDADGTAHDGLIQFSVRGAKFFLTYGTTPYTGSSPYYLNATTSKIEVPYGYIDLVGLDDGSFWSATENTPGYEGTALNKGPFRFLQSDRLFTRYLALDPCKQAGKAPSARTNSTQWYYVDLTKNDGDIVRSISAFTPKASKSGKDFFFNKSLLYDNKPTIITCSLGINGTAASSVAGNIFDFSQLPPVTGRTHSGATRCFNWVSKDYYDEYLWLRKSGTTDWLCFESLNDTTLTRSDVGYYYNRIRQDYSDGSVLTAHKQIIYNIPVGTYEYFAGRANSDGSPNYDACTDVHTFTVERSDKVVTSGLTFVQTSDQQGFNWDEYQMWKYSADYIAKNENVSFMINTGDMTQNGSRINEWIDYFDAKMGLTDMPEMATVGNNDLSPKDLTVLGFGSDSEKINATNLTFFYTFEIDDTNPPIFNITGLTIDGQTGQTVENVYVPSLYSFNYGNVHFLCINSETTHETESKIYGLPASTSDNGFINKEIKRWAQQDLDNYKAKNGSSTSTDADHWVIAYCHEMPFTIITDSAMAGWYVDGGTSVLNGKRGGSHLNTVVRVGEDYWFSEFCQNNGIRLVIGGHKHTEATTWPLLENVVYKETEGVTTRTVTSMMPIIQVTAADLSKYFGADGLTEITATTYNTLPIFGKSYPSNWIASDGTLVSSDVHGHKPSYEAFFCGFELKGDASAITAPVYAMSQATGYKHTSNKELPNTNIPWLRYYYPKNGTKANNGQKYPFYTVWNINGNTITGEVKKVNGLFTTSGTFELNEVYVRKNAPGFTINTINGLENPYKDSDEKIIIKK